jgi:transposase
MPRRRVRSAILRREGLYCSHVIDWRRALDAAVQVGWEPVRGRPRTNPRDAQIARLMREKEQLEQELAKARFMAEVLAKLHAGRLSPGARTAGRSERRDRCGDRGAGVSG